MSENNLFQKKARVHILPAYSDEKIFVFLARGLRLSTQNLDKDEIIKVVKYPLEQALQMIAEGHITDALTILSLQFAWFYLKGERSKRSSKF
jgi:ADP-ribose pyrophosphatase